MADLPIAAGDDLHRYLPLLGCMPGACSPGRFNQNGGFPLQSLLFLQDRLEAAGIPLSSELQEVINARVVAEEPPPAVELSIETLLPEVLSAMPADRRNYFS
jgi:hypothetical protein